MGILNKKTKKTDEAPKAEETQKVTPVQEETSTALLQHKDVLVRPVVSEKTVSAESKGVYTFVVSLDATKIDIKNAVKAKYGVLPKTVRVMNVEGKRTRFGRRKGRRNDWKKAVVTVAKGQTLNIHEGV